MSTTKVLFVPLDHAEGYEYGEYGDYNARYHGPHVSHTGLAISALNTAKVLRANGVNAVVRPVKDTKGIEYWIEKEQPTNVVINALWFPTADLQALVNLRTDIQFVLLIHSNISFLQVEPLGVGLMRAALDLSTTALGNFRVAFNSLPAALGIGDAYGNVVRYLPNLYFLDGMTNTNLPKWAGGTIRIGAFGALRALKNPTTSAAAALSIARNLGTDLEFHINTGRDDMGGQSVLVKAVESFVQGIPGVTLVKDNWSAWTGFRKLVRHMHLLLAPSYTESFCMVVADGIAEGIASVVGTAIPWTPDKWQSDPDSVDEVMKTGLLLLEDKYSGIEGIKALTKNNVVGLGYWKAWLSDTDLPL
jgi:hypothetical protein